MKQRLMGSKKFWMVLVAILGVFILMASVLLLFDYSNKTVNDGYQQQGTYVEQPTTGEVDHSFEATKDRVDSINSNYGQQIKSAYSGETSAMEKMIQHRIVFSTIKNVLLYAVLILMILLILVKGFNLNLFKKKLVEDGTEEPQKQEPKPENKPIKKGTGEQAGKKPAPKPKKEEPVTEEVVETKADDKKKTADEEEVVSGCQLP